MEANEFERCRPFVVKIVDRNQNMINCIRKLNGVFHEIKFRATEMEIKLENPKSLVIELEND